MSGHILSIDTIRHVLQVEDRLRRSYPKLTMEERAVVAHEIMMKFPKTPIGTLKHHQIYRIILSIIEPLEFSLG